MRTIKSYLPPIQFQTQIESGRKGITRPNQVGETTAVSTAKGMTLNAAQQLALTNGRLFDAGVSVAVLNRPGTVGKVFDTSSAHGADKSKVHFNGSKKPLADVLKDTMLAPMTDQIGRKTADDGEAWIFAQLETLLMAQSGEHASGRDFKSLLTKVKAMCGFGTTVWQLMNPFDPVKRGQNEAVLRDVMTPLGEGITSQFGARFDEFNCWASRLTPQAARYAATSTARRAPARRSSPDRPAHSGHFIVATITRSRRRFRSVWRWRTAPTSSIRRPAPCSGRRSNWRRARSGSRRCSGRLTRSGRRPPLS